MPFTFSDLTNIKQRPVLVISKNKDNTESDDIITCSITSNLKKAKYSVLINNRNLENGDIPKESRIKIDKLFTLDKDIIKKRIAKINQETFNKVKSEFIKLI